MAQNEELRIVRGNAFNIKIQVEAVRLDGTKVDNFNLAEANAQLKVWHAGQKTAREFVIDGNNAIISFDGTEMLGWYGLEMSGTFESAPWRFAVVQVFQIVETNEKANVPSWTILTDQTYFVEGVLTLYANGATYQADWDETDTQSPSYIKNKPNLGQYATKVQLQQTEQHLQTEINGKQDTIEDLQQIREDAAAGATAYQKPAGGIPSTDMAEAVQTSLQKAENAAPQATTYTKEQVDAMIADFITRSVNDLMNYYLKSETYTKAEVQQLIDTVKQFTYEVVTTLPTASEETMHKIYLVPSTNPQTQNVKDEYITIATTSGSTTTYSWEQIGTTTVDLSGYYTSAQTDQAITNALNASLASYYTKSQIDTMVQTINQSIAAKASQSDLTAETTRAQQAEQANAQRITTLDGLVAFINKSFGKYDGQREIVLQQAKSGKYVNTDGGETTASGYGISAPITLNAGDILLIPSAQAVPASVSVVARMVDRTYQKVIAYIYTYREDYPELPATATADYDSTLVYTAVYDESGDTPVLTGWTRAGQTYTTLPATREVSEQFYEPLVRQTVSAMPSTGYYIYLSPTAMTVVVSGLTATVSGGTALVVGWGIFKNITTNFVGAPGQSVLAQAFAVIIAAIDGLKAQLDNLGETKAVSIDFEEQPKLCGQDMHIVGSGAPAAPVVPTMIGQEYLDVTNKKCYKAFSITNSVSDWVLLN
ncbi:MAG: hypothetical protein IKA00_04180 [Prevotella sp.]|nr:hypothetical protein [Prevotella sp.]